MYKYTSFTGFKQSLLHLPYQKWPFLRPEEVSYIFLLSLKNLKHLVLYSVVLASLSMKAQDKVYFLDGTSKEGKITEVSSDYVILESADDTETLPNNKILLLEFPDGKTEIRNKPSETLIYNSASRAKAEPRPARPKEYFNSNFFSLNTAALCNADVAGFYEHIVANNKIGLGVMGAYNFNPNVTFPNLFIAVLDNAKKNYDLGAFANFYPRGFRKRTTIYFGLLIKYTNFRFTSVIEENVTMGGAVTTNIRYKPSSGSQLATLFTFGTHTNLSKIIFLHSLLGIGGFNMHGDYRQQYNYFLNKANTTTGSASTTNYNVKFLPKFYFGLNIGVNF